MVLNFSHPEKINFIFFILLTFQFSNPLPSKLEHSSKIPLISSTLLSLLLQFEKLILSLKHLKNIPDISCTMLTSQFSNPLQSKLEHLKNILDIFVTLLTFHLDKSELKFSQNQNICSMFVTLLTSQLDISELNLKQFLNFFSISPINITLASLPIHVIDSKLLLNFVSFVI